MSLDIHIKTVPLSHIRCGQVDDWFINNDGSIEVLIAELNGNWESETALGFHGALEAIMCKHAGIPEDEVTRFDERFEQERANGKQTVRAEPGDDINSPYRIQHQAATYVERSVVSVLGLDWETHDSAVIQ